MLVTLITLYASKTLITESTYYPVGIVIQFWPGPL